LLRRIDRGAAVMVVSVALALEYEAICGLPRHREAAGLTDAEVARFVDGLLAISEPARIHYRWRPQLRDPGDELVLEAAVNGNADAIVSFNQRHFADAPGRFGKELLLPAQLLKRIPS
jgi:predicted nucleic acid-binding protein